MKAGFRKPPGELAGNALCLLGCAAFSVYAAVSWSSGLFWLIAALFAASAVGVWRVQQWGRWLGIALFAVVAIWTGTVFFPKGRWIFGVLATTATLYGSWDLWRSWPKKAQEDSKPLISIVLLLREPRYLEAPVLAQIASVAWGVPFTSEGEAETGYVVGESPLFIVSHEKRLFLVNNFERPYFADCEEVMQSVPDLRLRHAIEEHNAWISVDLMGREDETPSDEAYTIIARLVGELAGPDCVGLFQPATGALNAFDKDMEEMLRGPHPLEVFKRKHVPVIQVNDDDPRMKAAVAEARQRWPEFLEAFKARQPDDRFSVKAPVTRDGRTEFIWIDPAHIDGEEIYGRLGNQPIALGDLKEGDMVSANVAEVNDWIFVRNDKMEGGFSVKVLQRLIEEQKQSKPT